MSSKLIKPIEKVNATIIIPGSKSITNRALLIASLAKGKSTILNPLMSDDTQFMIQALKQFGVTFIHGKNAITVYGNGGIVKKPKKQIFIGNAGTAMRFLTAYSALCPGKVRITGNERMKQRPIKDLTHALQELGVAIKDSKGFPPVMINGGTFRGKTVVRGEVSSQFISALLMIAPYAPLPITIAVKGTLTSKPYVDITIECMKRFGVVVENNNYKEFRIPGRRKYKASQFIVEPDASNASYFMAAAAITKGKVRIPHLSFATKQGDLHFLGILKKMGCRILKGKDRLEIQGKDLKGIAVNMNDMPDTVQTLAVVAVFAHGPTTITGIGNLRCKETDRISALAKELRKIGARVNEYKNSLTITPYQRKPATIETYDDHRMAMSFAVAGLQIKGIQIKNPQCVQKSFPGFWKEFRKLYS